MASISLKSLTARAAKKAEPLTKEEIFARAQVQMRRGKRLVIVGFAIAIVGMIAYCVVSLAAGMNQNFGATVLESPGWLGIPSLGLVGIGTVVWLVGSVIYLSGAMDSDPEGPDVSF